MNTILKIIKIYSNQAKFTSMVCSSSAGLDFINFLIHIASLVRLCDVNIVSQSLFKRYQYLYIYLKSVITHLSHHDLVNLLCFHIKFQQSQLLFDGVLSDLSRYQSQLRQYSIIMYLIKRIRLNSSSFSTVKPSAFQDDYQLLECLGQGSTSRVYLSLDVKTNEKVIVKLFKKVLDHKIQRQSRILKLVKNCPHVQQLKEIVQNAGFLNYGFVFHYYPGQMLNKLIKELTLKEIRLCIKQLLVALKCIHGKGIMHRDIKPSNILISDEKGNDKKEVVLLDFGLAEIVKPNEVYKYRVGTNCYKPPEVLLKRTSYNEKIDIWGVGLILTEMLIKTKPLFKHEEDEKEMLQKLMKRCNHASEFMTKDDIELYGIQRFQGIKEKSMSESGIKLAQKMMDFNPQRRPSAEEALKDKFFTQL